MCTDDGRDPDLILTHREGYLSCPRLHSAAKTFGWFNLLFSTHALCLTFVSRTLSTTTWLSMGADINENSSTWKSKSIMTPVIVENQPPTAVDCERSVGILG